MCLTDLREGGLHGPLDTQHVTEGLLVAVVDLEVLQSPRTGKTAIRDVTKTSSLLDCCGLEAPPDQARSELMHARTCHFFQ